MELLLIFGLAGLIGAMAGGGSGDGGTSASNVGLSLRDDVTGTSGADDIDTGDGNDHVQGLDGNDTIDLGNGNDVADAGAGDDTVNAAAGSDLVIGGAGNDVIDLGAGDDLSLGYPGVSDDLEYAGDDVIRGGGGNDEIVDLVGRDTLYGDAGNDRLGAIDYAGTPDAPDALYGGDGADLLVGDDGDLLTGGAGIDGFWAWFDETSDQEVMLADYDAANEVLTLEFDSSVFPTYTSADVTTQVVGGDLRIFVDGMAVAVLQGMTSYNPANVVISMY